MGCRAACQGEYRHPRGGKKVVPPGLPVTPARIASTRGGGFAVSVFVEELPSCAPSETCCRLVQSDSQPGVCSWGSACFSHHTAAFSEIGGSDRCNFKLQGS